MVKRGTPSNNMCNMMCDKSTANRKFPTNPRRVSQTVHQKSKAYDKFTTVDRLSLKRPPGDRYLIPRLHDEAGSTSWLYERSSSTRRSLIVGSTSARWALVERSSSSFVNVYNITPFKWPDSQLIKPALRAHVVRSTCVRRASSSSQPHRVNGV